MSAQIHQVGHALIDIGLNLTSHKYVDRLPAVLQNAVNANVSHILITGTSIKSSQKAITLAKTYQNPNMQNPSSPILHTTFGVHPHDAQGAQDTKKLKKDIEHAVKQHPLIVKAVGECGLDYNRMFSPKETQIEVTMYNQGHQCSTSHGSLLGI